MTRLRYPRARVRQTPEGEAPAKRGRGWLIAALCGVVVAVVALLWFARSGNGGRGGRDEAAAREATGRRGVGPSGGLLSRRRNPTASDVLGALRSAPGGSLVRVEGRVIDAISRAPVGGVEVVFSGTTGEETATADAGGAYTMDVAPGDYRAFVRGDHVISVGAAAWERLPVPPDPLAANAPDDTLATMISVQQPQRGVDLEVQRSGTVTGRVLDATGQPVIGAVVRALVGPWRPVLGTDVAETAADGRFALEVPAGYYDLDAAHPDFAGAAQTDGMRPNVMVYPEMETEVTLTLTRGCIIAGRAVRRDGTPVGSGALERRGPEEFFPAGPIADDGTFRYTSVVEEEITLRAWPWKSPPSDPQSVRCAEGVRAEVVFQVPDQAPDASGRIVDAHGAPQPGAYIDVYGIGPGTMNQQERADAQGNWAVYSLPPGEYAITAHVPGRGVAAQRVQVPGHDIELMLGGTGGLAGRVDGVDDGETFQLTVNGCVSDVGSVVMPQSTRLVPVIGGRYQVDDLPACALVITARSSSRTVMTQVAVQAGDIAHSDLDLTAPRAKTVRVSVVDPNGNAVPGAQLVVTHMDGAPSADTATTDSQGVASIDAHAGDIVHAFFYDPQAGSVGGSGDYQVSDAPGSTEDATIRLEMNPTWDP